MGHQLNLLVYPSIIEPSLGLANFTYPRLRPIAGWLLQPVVMVELATDVHLLEYSAMDLGAEQPSIPGQGWERKMVVATSAAHECPPLRWDVPASCACELGAVHAQELLGHRCS